MYIGRWIEGFAIDKRKTRFYTQTNIEIFTVDTVKRIDGKYRVSIPEIKSRNAAAFLIHQMFQVDVNSCTVFSCNSTKSTNCIDNIFG
jgi:hypothetical protein